MNSSDQLKKINYRYFSNNPNGKLRINANRWVECSDVENEKGGIIRPGIKQYLQEGKENVIISAETFSWIYQKEPIKEFYNELEEIFDEIVVIVYIRRQDRHVVSHFQQSVRTGASSRFYRKGTKAIPEYEEYLDLYLNYNLRLDLWAEVFGKENFIVRVFDRKELIDGDVVSDFYSTLGIDIEYDKINTNESFGFERTKILHLMKEMNVPDINQSKIKFNLNNTNKMLPSRKDAQEFYEKYKKHNKELNRKYKISKDEYIFDDDFSMYKLESQDEWEQDKFDATLNRTVNVLNKKMYMNQKEVQVLINSAIAIENEDLNTAYKLMRIAQKYSQKMIIKTKIIEYKKSLK